jgi:hypothetical protein
MTDLNEQGRPEPPVVGDETESKTAAKKTSAKRTTATLKKAVGE